MEDIGEVCRALALTVSEKKIETMFMTSPRTPQTMMRVGAAGQLQTGAILHPPRGRHDQNLEHVR